MSEGGGSATGRLRVEDEANPGLGARLRRTSTVGRATGGLASTRYAKRCLLIGLYPTPIVITSERWRPCHSVDNRTLVRSHVP